MAILSNLTKRCVLCKFSLRISRIVNKKLKIGVWISFFCFKIQNIKFKILNGRTVHGPTFLVSSFMVTFVNGTDMFVRFEPDRFAILSRR